MIVQGNFDYKDGEQTYEGFIAYDDQINTVLPVVMVVHAYKGLLEFEKKKTIELARMGYVGFAVDLYGKGRRGSNVVEGRILMGELENDRKLLLSRMQFALEQAKQIKQGDENQIAAIGFCFGGKCCLDLARSGEGIKGIAVFHGVFDPPENLKTQEIKTKVLVLHGYDDPLAKPDAMIALSEELTEANAQWEICVFGHTGHAFTNPSVNSPDAGMQYYQLASDRSWSRTASFFNEIFTSN